MKRKTLKQSGALASFALLFVLAMHSLIANAQANAQRFLGTITTIAGDMLTIKPDSGDARQVQVPSLAVLKRIAPGQKDLSTAETIQLSDLTTGDRVLVKLDPNVTGTPQVLQLIAMKQSDIAQKQQQERDDWQRNGVGGLVKSVDIGSGVVVVTSGAGPTAKTITIHIGKNALLKRYAPNSIRFSDAQPAPIEEIRTGDQLRARGQKNADGTEIDATAVVSGSFRNISGTVSSIDAASSTLSVKDLVTKKNVTIHIAPDAQMRRLPDMMARMIAARLKGTTLAGSGGAAVTQQGGAGSPPPQAMNGQPGGQGPGQGRPRGDMETVLDRAPAIQLADLQKGEAVMLVSTEGTTDVTAIKLLAGVEPLLESPEASRNLLANWSMGSGGAELAGSQ
ncbi:MAG TPA: hypothetical protein VKB47_08490 [Terracidiphilus sp.]|nr:hypothetical protein [Terracidiphilus sp.]